MREGGKPGKPLRGGRAEIDHPSGRHPSEAAIGTVCVGESGRPDDRACLIDPGRIAAEAIPASPTDIARKLLGATVVVNAVVASAGRATGNVAAGVHAPRANGGMTCIGAKVGHRPTLPLEPGDGG